MKDSNYNSKLVWDNCLQYIKSKINPQSYKTWFEPIVSEKLENNILTIQVPNHFFYEWLEEHHVDILREVIKKELGQDGKLAYSIKRPIELIEETPIKLDENKLEEKKFSFSSNYQIHFDNRYVFENFIEGDSNRLAKSAAQAIAKKPGETAFNPFLIYGGVGLGKTHIMRAIVAEIKKLYPNKNCFYLSSEHFTNSFIESIRNNEIQDFIDYFLKVDALLIDDIQFLTGKEKTQEMFFHIFNHLHQYGKQLVITSDCPPIKLKGLQERLLSRFSWGLTTDIQKPDFETKVAIIQSKLISEKIDIPLDLIKYIASSIDTNIRDLEGILISILAHSSLRNTEITFDLVKQVISNIVNKIETEINIKFLQKLVCEQMHISLDNLLGNSRKQEFVIARQFGMYLSKKYTNHSLKSIGEQFGGKHHSTVIHAMQAVEDMVITKRNFKKQLNELENMVKLKIPQN